MTPKDTASSMGLRHPVRSLICRGHFPQKSSMISGSFAEMTSKDSSMKLLHVRGCNHGVCVERKRASVRGVGDVGG